MSTVNLTAFKKAEPKGKKEKPTLPDPTGALSALVAQGVNAKQQSDAWDASLKDVNKQLATAALAHAFAHYHGRTADIEDSFIVRSGGNKVTVSLKNAYKMPEDLAPVRAVLGGSAEKYLRQSFVISVDSDAIPEQWQQMFVDELVSLARRLDEFAGAEPGQDGPILSAITVKQETTVAKSFHGERHAAFTPEQNHAIHAVLPCVVSARYDY
jgi:hypothetical protein